MRRVQTELSTDELYWLASYYQTTLIPGLSPERLFPFEQADAQAHFDAGQDALLARRFVNAQPAKDDRSALTLSTALAQVTDIVFGATHTLAITVSTRKDGAATVFHHRDAGGEDGIVTHTPLDGGQHAFQLHTEFDAWRETLPGAVDADASPAPNVSTPRRTFEIDAESWSNAIAGQIDAATLASAMRASSDPKADAQAVLAAAKRLATIAIYTLLTVEHGDEIMLTSASAHMVTAGTSTWLVLPKDGDQFSISELDRAAAAETVDGFVAEFMD
jgi:hypothetical protein